MPMPAKDMKGQKIGRLLVLEMAENTKDNKARWLCKCDCGKLVVIPRASFTKNVKSCGCYVSDLAREQHTTHGMKGTRIYRIWTGMKDRCLNSKSKYWERYGGRGIKVYEEWKKFENFYSWAMENGYSEDLTLDRIDNDGNYEPNNCRWATYQEQENNRSNNKIIEYNGETMTVSQLANKYGIKPKILHSRLYKGWDIDRALTQKIRRA